MALEEIGELQQAIACYENCLAGDSKFLNAYVHLGQLLAAADRFRRILKQDPQNMEARQNSEQACETIGIDCKGRLSESDDLKQRIDLHSG
jgi:tetratricopeptide (TPR) repeat protein